MKNQFDIGNKPLGFYLGFTMRLMRSTMSAKLKTHEIDITWDQFPILKQINGQPDLSQKKMVERVRKEKTTVSRQISLLEKKGYINRRTDPNDKRNRLLNLTDKGQEVIESLSPIIEEMQELLSRGFSLEEENRLKEMLLRICENLLGEDMDESLHDIEKKC